MSLPLDFRNILNIYNLSDSSEFTSAKTYTIEDNVNIFTKWIDGRDGSDRDSQVSLDEYREFLNLLKIPTNMADALFSSYDTNNDNILDATELTNIFAEFDSDNSDSLEFSEGLNFYNAFSNINVPDSTTFGQYSGLFKNAQMPFFVYDEDGDLKVSQEEYKDMLIQMGASEDDAVSTSQTIINYYDQNSDGMMDFEEALSRCFGWDTNENGIIEYELGEAKDLVDQMPWYIRPSNAMSQIERTVQSLILTYDANQDRELDFNEYKWYMTYACHFPEVMAQQVIDLYGGEDGSISYDEMVSAYRTFDTDGEDSRKSDS